MGATDIMNETTNRHEKEKIENMGAHCSKFVVQIYRNYWILLACVCNSSEDFLHDPTINKNNTINY